MEESLKEALQIHKSLVVLSKLGEVQIKNVTAQAAPVDPAKMKGHTLQNATLQVGVPIVMLQHYVNQILHLLLCPAIVAVSVQHSVQQDNGFQGAKPFRNSNTIYFQA